jgi:uncharacterized protein with HEPN domain
MSSDRTAEHLADILQNIERIHQHLGSMNRAEFAADGRTRDAIERCLMRLSEAAVRLGVDGQRLCPDQPWRDIRGLGNHLRHAYDRIDEDELWNILQRDLPSLEVACRYAFDRLKAS